MLSYCLIVLIGSKNALKPAWMLGSVFRQPIKTTLESVLIGCVCQKRSCDMDNECCAEKNRGAEAPRITPHV